MANTLTLPIGEATQRKLKALAMLSGSNVGSIEEQLAGYLDEMITLRCAELLGIETAPVERAEGLTYSVTFPEDRPEPTQMALRKDGTVVVKKSFADAERAAAGKPSEEVEEAFSGMEVQDEVSGHELSGDTDTGENKSLAEQAEEMSEEDREIAAAIRPRTKPNQVVDDEEAFLDASMGSPEGDTDEIPSATRGYAGQGPYGERPMKATKSFESRMRKGHRARVSPHTGED